MSNDGVLVTQKKNWHFCGIPSVIFFPGECKKLYRWSRFQKHDL
jgi:hypothetical protein